MEMTQAFTRVICPKCGAFMVRRIAKHGFNKGNYFLGCSKFPECGVILAKECLFCGSDMVLIYDPKRPKFKRFCWACTKKGCNSRKPIWDNGDYVVKRDKYTPLSTDKHDKHNVKKSPLAVSYDYEEEDTYSEDEMIDDLLDALGDFDDWDPDFQDTYGDAYKRYRQNWDDD